MVNDPTRENPNGDAVDIRKYIDYGIEKTNQSTKTPLDDLVLGGKQMLSPLELSRVPMSGYASIYQHLNIAVQAL